MKIEDRQGLSWFLGLRRFLLDAGTEEARVPLEHEMELIAARNRASGASTGVLVASTGGRVVGYVPYLQRRRDIPVRVGEKVLTRLCFRAVQLLRPNSSQWGEDPAICGEFLKHVAESCPGAAICASEVDTGGVLWRAFDSIGRELYMLSRAAPYVHVFHRFEGTYDEFLRGRSKKTRAQIRNNWNRLKRIAGDRLALEEYSDVADVARFLATAGEISTRTYQARLFGEVVAATAEVRQLYELYAHRGLFRSYVLRVGEKPIAFLLAHGEPDGTHVWVTMGYDPDWRECSPGTNCAVMVLARLYELGIFARIDFGGGYSEQKRILGNFERMAVSPVLFPRTARGVLLRSVESGVEGVNRRAVELMAGLRLKGRIKRWLRR